MCLNTRRIDKTGAKQLDLSFEVNDFKGILYGWDKWESELQHCCGISVQHVRKYVQTNQDKDSTRFSCELTGGCCSWNLPDDVFDPGEVKPAKPNKKKAGQAPNGVKRKAPTQVCSDAGVAYSRKRLGRLASGRRVSCIPVSSGY